MKKRKDRLNSTFRMIKDGKTIRRYETHSKRRFYNRIRSINWQDKGISVYLRVYYGKEKDAFGEITSFYNDGVYKTKKGLWQAFRAFTESGLSED